MGEKRSQLHQEIVEALIESKAVDFEVMGSIFSKYAARAALEGEELVNIVNYKFQLACGWPGPEILNLREVGALSQVG